MIPIHLEGEKTLKKSKRPKKGRESALKAEKRKPGQCGSVIPDAQPKVAGPSRMVELRVGGHLMLLCISFVFFT